MHTKIRLFPKKIIYFALYFVILEIINLKKDISLPADSLNQPYLFIKEGNRTSRVFVIEKDDYKSIEQYVEMLSRILNKIN